MIDIYLRADDEATLKSALLDVGLWPAGSADPTTGYVLGGDWGALDLIGQVWRPKRDEDGQIIMTTAENGNQMPVMELLPGFHGNLRLVGSTEVPQELAELTVNPNSPIRVFAT